MCCNPFGRPEHSSKRKNLRQVLPWMCEKLPSLTLGEKVCDDCRKKLAQIPTPSAESAESYGSSQKDASTRTQCEEYLSAAIF